MRYDPRTDQAHTIEELGYPGCSREEATTSRLRGSLALLNHDYAVALAHSLGLRIGGVDV